MSYSRAMDILRRLVDPDPWDTAEEIRRDAALLLAEQRIEQIGREQEAAREARQRRHGWLAL